MSAFSVVSGDIRVQQFALGHKPLTLEQIQQSQRFRLQWANLSRLRQTEDFRRQASICLNH